MRIESGLGAAGWHDLQDSGAYEWWYYDALSDDARTAVVVILFAGLPFSPDYLTAHERGERPHPLDHVAIFAALYRDGRQVAYALNRHAASDFTAKRTAPEVSVGKSSAVWSEETARIRLTLDVPLLLGGDRLTGSLVFEPILAPDSVDFGSGAPSEHVWNPIAPICRVDGALEVEADGTAVVAERLRGAGYHDHNYGSRPLTEGIARWSWGRVHFGDAGLVFYANENEHGAVETVVAALAPGASPFVDATARVTPTAWRRRPLCPRHPRALELSARDAERSLEMTVRVERVLDWGPFYMRFLARFEGAIEGERIDALGITEYLDPRGLGRRYLRPLIKTRIQQIPPPST